MKGQLEIETLDKRFGGVQALSGVNLTVPSGQIFAVIGPNGAGKSTFLNILTGLLPASSGTIRYAGRDITRLHTHQIIRLGIGRTFQNGKLFMRLTALENVMVGGDGQFTTGLPGILLGARRFREEEKVTQARSLEILDRLGLDDVAHLPVSSLPYGRRRMVELARALVQKPDLLLLDEPAAGLNSGEVLNLSALLREIRSEGVTIVLIEHNMGMVMDLADRVAVLNFGEKIAEGSLAEIQRDERVLEAYLGRGYQHVAL